METLTHLLKGLLVEVHHHVRIHVEESPVGVVREALVTRGVDDALHTRRRRRNREHTDGGVSGRACGRQAEGR